MRRKPKKRFPVVPTRKVVPARGEVGAAADGPSRQRVWMFRLTSLLMLPLLLLVALEVCLRAAGFGYGTSLFLPARINQREVLVQNNRFTWRFFGPEMAREPFPLAISKQKPPGTTRVFVFGESAAYGDPQPEFGLARILETLLRGRYPGRKFEVVNVAMTAINSHVILPIARDCARQNGDVWVVYMGNNEVVGPFGAGTVFGPKAANLALIRLSLALRTTRTGQALDKLLARVQKRPDASREWGGMAMFMNNQVRREDPRMAAVYAHFERNLSDILDLGHRNGVKLLVGTVVSNLKDCAPFASVHRPGLAPDDLAEWDRLYKQGTQEWRSGRPTEASEYFQKAGRIDETFADLQYAWGQCCLVVGRDGEALKHLTRARDEDVLRFRADTSINEIIRREASGRETEGIRLVDGAGILAQQSPHALTGDEFLYEHVHLNFEGNYLLARAFAEGVVSLFPELSAGAAEAPVSWPSAAECAQRLAWTDWNGYEAAKGMLGRLTDPPFASQLNHDAEYAKMRRQLEQLLPSTTPAALEGSTKVCRAALAAAPDDWVLNRELASLREKLSDFAGAAEAWRTTVRLMPHYTEGWQALGQVLAEQKQDMQAGRAFEQALRLEPDSVVTLTGLAQIRSRQGRQADAIRQYEHILTLKPYWGPAQLGLGKALEAIGRPLAAQPHFRQALQNRIYTPAALKALGEFCFEKGWFKEAATNFLDALKLDPLDAATEVNLGLTLGLLGRSTEAQSHYAAALSVDPNLAEAHVRLGFELGRQGDDAAAMNHFAKAVRLKPELLEARLDLAIALMNQHRETEALDQFQEVLRRSPTNAVALKNARVLSERLRVDPGEPSAQQN